MLGENGGSAGGASAKLSASVATEVPQMPSYTSIQGNKRTTNSFRARTTLELADLCFIQHAFALTVCTGTVRQSLNKQEHKQILSPQNHGSLQGIH
eukprot:scaffold107084_cov19-Tisochrysis_lutea.AAC.2